MDDNFEITPDGVIKPTEEKPKPKPKSRKAKVALRDNMYLALHGLYSNDVSIKRGSICFIVGDERIAKLIEVNAIRKVDDIEIVKLESISRYHSLMASADYASAGDFLSQSDSEIAESTRIPHNLVMRIRKLIEDELTK